MKSFVFTVGVIAFLLGVTHWSEELAGWSSAFARSFATNSDVVEYLTETVTAGDIRRTIAAAGTLQAVVTVKVSSQLSGQIAHLHADFNDDIARGQPLVELDQRGFKAHLVQAEAELEMARENVTVLTAKVERAEGLEQEAIAQRKVFEAKVEQAQVNLNAATRKLKQIEQLANRKVATQAEVENARTDRDAAAAALREAEAVASTHEHAIASKRAGRREAEAEFANAQAALPLRQGAVTLARLDLENSVIRAPISGVVVERSVEQGQIVAADLDAPTLFTIAGDLSKMQIHARIDETDIAEIATGQAAEFTVDAFPGRSFPARVSEIRKAAVVVEGVVAYTVVLEATNPAGLLLPGMTATARIIVENLGAVRIVPLAALRFVPSHNTAADGGRARDQSLTEGTVWVLNRSQNPEPRRVRLGPDNGYDVAVVDGNLQEGDRIITSQMSPEEEFTLFGIRF